MPHWSYTVARGGTQVESSVTADVGVATQAGADHLAAVIASNRTHPTQPTTVTVRHGVLTGRRDVPPIPTP